MCGNRKHGNINKHVRRGTVYVFVTSNPIQCADRIILKAKIINDGLRTEINGQTMKTNEGERERQRDTEKDKEREIERETNKEKHRETYRDI